MPVESGHLVWPSSTDVNALNLDLFRAAGFKVELRVCNCARNAAGLNFVRVPARGERFETVRSVFGDWRGFTEL